MKWRSGLAPYLLAFPAVLWVLVFSIWPFLNTVWLSFTNARPLRTPEPVGLSNYARLFADEQFGYAVTTSLTYTLIAVPLLTFLPLLVALLVKAKVPGISFFRTTIYFPVIASVVVVGIIWMWMFDSQGLVNQTLQVLGVTDRPVNFLVDRWLIILTAALLTIWKGLGYYMVVYLAALGSIDKELYEAAALDGAGAIGRFWHVTVPGVRGAMLLITALITAAAMRVFSELYVLTNGSGGPGGHAMSLVMQIKQVGSGLTGQIGYASALSVTLFVLTIGPMAFVGWIQQGDTVKEAWARWRKGRAYRKSRVVAS